MIFPAVFQTILNLDWGYDVSSAIEYGRLHDQLYPLEVQADDIYPSETLADLEGRGHNITGTLDRSHGPLLGANFVTVLDVNRIAAVVQAVVKKEGVVYGMCTLLCGSIGLILHAAASDSRKNGVAAGY